MAVAIAMGIALRDAGLVAVVAWWVTVGAMVVDLVVPSTIGLTAMRMVAPVTIVAAVLAVALGAPAVPSIVALALALLATALVLSGEIGEAMVQGSAYGHEQRFPLRPPAALLLPMATSWVLWCATVLGSILLLRDHRWALGVVVTAVAGALTWLLAGRFNRLSNRWLVLVPAGVVVRDPLVLGETLMVQRHNLAGVQLALDDTRAADLTGPAAGNAVEVAVHEVVLAVFPSSAEHPTGRAIHVQSFLVSPTRPGRVLQWVNDR